MSKLMMAICAAATLAGAVLASGFVSPAAAVTKAEGHTRYSICRASCRPDNHNCKRTCKGRFQNCLSKAS